MQVLKQSTTATILVGPVLDADGAAYTSAVIGDFNITKNGSTAALAAAATATHSHNGMYLIALTTGNTDTLGRLDVSVNNTSYGMTNHRYEVLTANQFDALVTNGTITPAAIADAVYDEPYAGHTTPGTYGFLWDKWRKSNPAVTGEVTSAITPTTTQFSTDITGYGNGAFENAVLVFINGSTNADFRGVVSGYLQSNGVVTITPALPTPPVAGDEFTIAVPSFVYTLAQIQGGLATSSGVTSAFTEIKGTGWSSATDTLEQIRDASGGSSITVAPLQATAPNRVAGTEIVTYINDTSSIGPIVVTDGDGDPVDLSSYTLRICIERKENGVIDDNITPTISGAGNNQVTFTPTAACVNSTTPRKWSLRSTSNGQVFAFGNFTVEWPARLS